MQKQIQGFQLSPQQKRIWVLQQNSRVYQSCCAILLTGNLNVEVLKSAFVKVINRHEILRTSFYRPKGFKLPIQVISDRVKTSLYGSWDNREVSELELEAWFQSVIEQDFDEDLRLKTSLVRLSLNQHLLLIRLPSLCADAATLKNIACELSRCYSACLHGEELSDEPLQYTDIAQWQNELLETEELEAEPDYWQQLDFSILGNLKLPFSNQSGEKTQFSPHFITRQIRPELAAKIEAIAHDYNTSASVVFLVCWQVLLWRLTEQSDLIIGVASNGRNYEELQGSLGVLVKYLPLPCHLEENYPFNQLLARVEEFTEEISESQERFSWEEITQLNGNEPEESFFPFCFEFDSYSANYVASDVCFSLDKQYACTDQFAVKLSGVCRDDSLIAEFHYDANLFEVEDIQRLAGQFETLLASAVKNPSGAIASFDILSSLEREQYLVEFNHTKTADPSYSCIHHWFEAQCDRTPDKIAVVCENQQLTYRELNKRANQLAHHLQQMGVGPEVIVGICVERSLEMVIGVLGILKAGGAYLPLDPAYPKERLAFILEDTQAPVLVTQQWLLVILPEGGADLSWSSTGILEDVDKGKDKSGGAYFRSILCLDSDWEQIAHQSSENPISTVTSENLAYLIYTSGSTGKPKGTLIPHRGLVNYLTWCTQAYAVEEGEGTTVHSSLAFDLTITGLFSPLLVGRRVELLAEDFSIESLMSALRQSSNLSLVKITPAQLLLLSQQLSPSEAAGRTKAFIIGGENLLAEHIAFWQDYVPETVLVNEYGPTETVVGCCIYQVPPGELPSGSVPIGRPIANTQLYVLNSYLQPVPMGVVGELYIGGAGVARGYLNRPELTAEKFIPDPFSHEPGARLYKTGDLARFRPDGNLEFLGRIDHQVKVRGFRIELGEIEAVLVQHPGVREAVVMAREDVPGDQRLVAYMVPVTDATPTTSDLQRFLKARLPEYMVPSAFVMLDALPLTTNGKVDRQSLQTPNQVQLKREGAFVTPRTPVEEMLASIWSRVLGTEQVGIYDNFFELGGHSLLVTQVISRIKRTFEVELPLRLFFESPTVAGLAEAIQDTRKAEQKRKVPPIERVPRNGKLPLSFAQARLWFLDQLETGSFIYNTGAAVRLIGSLNVAVLERSLNEIVRRHETLRTTFPVVEGQSVQIIAPTLEVKLPIVDLRKLPEAKRDAEVQRLATEEAQQSFNLAQGPLLRGILLHISEKEYVLLFTMHHIVSDGWSIGLLIRELAVLYEAFCADKPSPLPELPIQYADFAVWQRQWLQGEVLENQLAYWKQQLGTNLPVLKLPTDFPRESVQIRRGVTHSFQIPSNLSKALQELSRQEGVTLFMTLLAGFQVLLQRYTNQDDIVVGTDIANRNRVETESLIGFFVNLLVLRTNLSGNPSFRELLKRVREVALGAYAHQDLPFEKLVAALQPDRQSSHTPLFQVLLVLQNAPMPALELPGLTLSLLEVEHETTKFDLGLFLTETEQGIEGYWQYNAELFENTTINRMSAHLETLLKSLVTQPDARINTLEILTGTEKEQKAVKKQNKAAKIKQFMAAQPQAVDLSQEKLIKTGYLNREEALPFVIQPNIEEVCVIQWAKNNREFIENQLLNYGAILFRGFDVSSVSEFERLAEAICPSLFGNYGDLPREGVSGKVYSSTPYLSELAILFHNESSHMHCWPQKIWFFCVQPSQSGGETPIVDCRKVFQMLNPKLRERFEQKQLMYVRNYTNGLDVSWQDFFHTTNKKEVEDYCRKASISVEWKPDEGLRTCQVRPAIIKHPQTGESVFFNQIQLHHASCLKSEVRESLLSTFSEDNLPRHVYYGDRSPIEDSVIEEIMAVYQKAQVSFPWQKGDVLMLDNMLTAHGRNPYVGNRKIVVAMGEMVKGA